MILCIGPTPTVQRTMTFEALTLDSVNRAAGVHEYASGKSINVARVAHTLGERVLATGFLGGERGRFLRADLDQARIAHDFVDVAPETRLCITVIDRAKCTATELIEESAEVAPQAYADLLSKVAGAIAGARVAVLSGTLTPGAPQRFYADCVSLAASVPTIVDARGDVLKESLSRRPFVVKPNRRELADTFDADVDDDDSLRGAMRELIARGARWAVVTAGSVPTLVTNGSQFWSIPVPRVDVVSAIGSGDAFAGGLAVGLVRGMQVPEACRLATACAVSNAMTPYAGYISFEVVKSLAAQVNPA